MRSVLVAPARSRRLVWNRTLPLLATSGTSGAVAERRAVRKPRVPNVTHEGRFGQYEAMPSPSLTKHHTSVNGSHDVGSAPT